jgi:hypothetical protein
MNNETAKKEVITEKKMEFPYCTVDGVNYQLEFDSSGTIRFPITKKDNPDLNNLVLRYVKGQATIQEYWEEYACTGCSYYMVEGIFSPFGINNVNIKAKGECKEMVLHSGDPSVDAQYNYSDEDRVYAEVDDIIRDLSENFQDDKDMLIDTFKKCIEKLETIK